MGPTRHDRQGTATGAPQAAPRQRRAPGARVARPTQRAGTTRELLAAVATSQLPRRRDGLPPEPRFVAWLLGSTLTACLVLLAVLWWLDPTSVTGRQTRFSVVENGGVRQAKLDLMEELEEAPQVLLLGSSRSMKLDPREVRRTSGATAFNAAVSGGTSRDMYLYARHAQELWVGDGEFPHLVLGVANDVLRDSGTAVHDPRLKRYLPRARRDDDRNALQVARELLQLTTVEAAMRAVGLVVPRDGLSALAAPEEGADQVDVAFARPGRQKGNQREALTPRGMQLPSAKPDGAPELRDRMRDQMAVYVDRSFGADPYDGVDERGLEMLVRTIRLANAHGDVPTLWLTPFHPDALEYLPEEHDARDARFRRAVARLQRDEQLRFRFVDLGSIDSFDGDPQEFEDGIHMTPANGARVIRRLHADGLLAPVA